MLVLLIIIPNIIRTIIDLVCGKQDGSSVGEKCCASENAYINHMAPQISTSDRTANNSTISNTAFTTSYNEGAVNGSMEYWSTNLHPGPNKLYYNGLNIYVINSITECDSILSMIPQSLLIFLGVDCEWAQPHHIIGYNEEATSKDLSYLYPVAMVQMATTNSQIYLIRLSRMNKQIPRSLVEILENPKYLKFGVNVMYDMERLRMNFKVDPKGAVDLRHLALGRMQGERMSLQALGKYFLGIELDKSYALQCSNWQCLTLDREQIIYAAMDAKVSLNIFLAIILIIMKQRDSSSQHNIFGPLSTEFENCATSICHSFIDVPFTYPNKHREHGNLSISRDSLKKTEAYATRKSPLYENCQLLAPDGELLSTTNKRKALWYIEHELGDIMNEEPLVIKLRFEPKCRPEPDNIDKLYYKAEMFNICVVCGKADGNGIRKKVVPSEYRQYFPILYKGYSSHDILLLCGICHQLCSRYDDQLKYKLSQEYDAPLDTGSSKEHTDATLFKVKNAARALNKGNNIPASIVSDYEKIIKEHYKTDDLTKELIEKATRIDPKKENPKFKQHGLRVVERLIDGDQLMQFQIMWREHFIQKMNPQFLPQLWSIKHNPNKVEYF